MTGSPVAIGLIATLWPAGIRSTVVTPSATASPGGRFARAISTPSSGCRRMTGAGVMGLSLEWANGELGWANGEWRVANRKIGSIHYSLLPIRHSHASRFSAGIFPRLRNLHLGVGHHQPAFVRQRHELESHVDGAHRAVGA